MTKKGLIAILLATALFAVAGQATGPLKTQKSDSMPKLPSGVTFTIVEERPLTAAEVKDRLPPDYIGPNYVVRVRLTTGEKGIVFRSWKESIYPITDLVRLDGSTIGWLSNAGEPDEISARRQIWLFLPAHSALEWEEIDCLSYEGETHAYTVFLKERGVEKECVSESYVVPKLPKPWPDGTP